jgi:hypothetical protein
MRIWPGLIALLLGGSAVVAADLYPVVGEPLKGEVVRLDDREVVFAQGDKKTTKPVKELLKIDFREQAKLPADKPYGLAELTDGTLLHFGAATLKGRTLQLALLAGPKIELPTTVVANLLMDASKDEHRRDWKSRVLNLRGKEAIVVKRAERVSSIECVLGEGDETGTAIAFAVTIDGETTTAKRKLASLHGVIFKHALDAKAAPATCKLLDTMQDVVMVSSLTLNEGNVSATTPAGVKIDFARDQVSRVDYTQGRLEYLSELTPSKLVARSNLEDDDKPDQWHVYKDTNLDKKPMVLGGTTYARGLALKPFVELVYDLKGEYREFEAVVGIDDGISAAGATLLQIEGDGKELTTLTISADDKVRHKTLKLSVKDVQKLRVVVKADGEFDTARHLNLADAKLRKEDR